MCDVCVCVCLLTDHALTESSLVEPSQRARFLAAQAPHSGDWLLALLIIPAKAFARDYVITGVRLSVCYHDN